MAKPLFAAEVTYKAIQEITTENESQTSKPEKSGHYYTLIWAIGLLNDSNLLNSTFSSDESIMESMNSMENP